MYGLEVDQVGLPICMVYGRTGTPTYVYGLEVEQVGHLLVVGVATTRPFVDADADQVRVQELGPEAVTCLR